MMRHFMAVLLLVALVAVASVAAAEGGTIDPFGKVRATAVGR